MMRNARKTLLTLATLATPTLAAGQDGKVMVATYIDEHAQTFADIAQEIWEFAELGYLETESSALLQQTLRDAGFAIESGVAGIPTAFVASWNNGPGPIVGILAEFDALPGITQDRAPTRSPIAGKPRGHACGHHLFGTGSTAAAIATQRWMEATGQVGEIRLYGTPAEEGGAGKVYMVRAGLFDDVDVMLHWHPDDKNDAGASSTLSNKSAKFRFIGTSAHAASAPEQGRSALDGVEAMNHMVNMMREHVPQETRIHYVITYGGAAPNVVPDFAEVFYYVRHPDPEQVKSIFERVANAAQGAALGTGTTMTYEVIHGLYNRLPNVVLQEAIHANLERVGGVYYDEEESRFADLIQETLSSDAPPIESAAQITPFTASGEVTASSTDVADVSWMVPTGGVYTATWVPGTSAHSWQAIASGGTSIGEKGMIVAAKTLAMMAIDLFTRPELVAAAKAEHADRIPEGWVYEPLLGDREPPLDYRLPAGPGGN